MTQRSDLQCDARGVRYDFEHKIGMLKMAPDNCCDMSSCIALFTGIDPDVQVIETYAGDIEDTIYKRAGKSWQAIPSK